MRSNTYPQALTRRTTAFHLLLLLTVGLLVYSNSFHGPFLLDEGAYLRDNPFVTTASGSLGSVRPGSELYKTIVQRYVGYISFAFNHRLHGLRVEGYHVVNVAIHLMNAVLVYLLALLTFRTPRLAGSALGGHARTVALFSGLLFVAHPVQTEAVTYIMQRLASLAAFFSLLSLILYIRWRLGGEGRGPAVGEAGRISAPDQGSLWWYAGSVLSAVLAMKTKENTLTLPVVILAYELFFFSGKVKKRIVRLLPLMATLLVIPASTLLLLMQGNGARFAVLASGEADAVSLSWPAYVLTQLRVMVTYYRLLMLPVNQTFLYDYPVYDALFHPEVFLSAVFHACVVLAGVALLLRSRRSEPALGVVSYGILWFYVTLVPESFLVPLPNVIFEYRLYLPSVGTLLAAATGVFLVLAKTGSRTWLKAGTAALSLLLTGAAAAAYQRNAVLSDHLALWEDTVRKSPNSAKAHTNLGTYLSRAGRPREALEQFETAVRVDPGFKIARHNIIIAYIRHGRPAEAAAEFEKLLGMGADAVKAHQHIGNLYMQEGFVQEAVAEYRSALRLSPANSEVRYDLANALVQQGNYQSAAEEYQVVIRERPDHIDARNNLGGVYAQLGRYEEARRELQDVLARNPGNEDARYNLKVVSDLIEQQRARK